MGKPRALTGWRLTATLLVSLTWTLTVILLILFCISISRTSSLDADTSLFTGSCATSTTINTALHLLLNAFSSCILASSNYFMQQLTSPTRADLDRAHARRKWMDVGIPSLKNLAHISGARVTLWILLVLAGVPLHLFANSAVYRTEVTNSFLGILAAESFTSSSSPPSPQWYLPGVGESTTPELANDAPGFRTTLQREINSIQANTHAYERLDARSCAHAYLTAGGVRDRRHFVIVVDSPTPAPPGAPKSPYYTANANGTGWSIPSLWGKQRCCRFGPYVMNDTAYVLWSARTYAPRARPGGTENTAEEWFRGIDDGSRMLSDAGGEGWRIGTTTPYVKDVVARYCLSEKVPGGCRVDVSNTLLLVVVLFAAMKAVACSVATRVLWRRGEPMATLGDCLRECLISPDASTRNLGVVGWRDFAGKDGGKKGGGSGWAPGPRQLKGVDRPKRLGSAVPWSAWLAAYGAGGGIFIVGAALLGTALRAQPWAAATFGSSATNERAGISVELTSSLAGAALVANTPQLLLSFAYLLYNALLTRMMLAREWAAMSIDFEPLRVTSPDPVGDQIESYRLTLPYAVAVPMIVLSIVLHWLVSNAFYIFLSNQDSWYPTPVELDAQRLYVGYSSPAIAAALCVAAGALAFPALLSLLPLPSKSAVVGSCSAAMSAACHAAIAQEHPFLSGGSDVIEGDAHSSESPNPLRDLVRVRLKWGVTSRDWGSVTLPESGESFPVEHVAFGSQDVDDVSEGAWYA